jgi:hypothetical protein
MAGEYQVGERVQIFLKQHAGWFDGKVVRIDPYSKHRSFYWVELDDDAQALIGTKLISILNPKNIKRIE